MERLTGRNEKGDLLINGKIVYAGELYEIASKLEEYEDMEEEEKIVKLPCYPGDKVYIIAECNYFPEVLDGDLYNCDGSIGDATGYYCPYDLNNKCPHSEEGFTNCDDYRMKKSVFEDYVDYFQVLDDGMYAACSETCFAGKIGEDIFLTKEEAEKALSEIKNEVN